MGPFFRGWPIDLLADSVILGKSYFTSFALRCLSVKWEIVIVPMCAVWRPLSLERPACEAGP